MSNDEQLEPDWPVIITWTAAVCLSAAFWVAVIIGIRHLLR